MNRTPSFRTLSAISLTIILSACAAPHIADQRLTLESTDQIIGAEETAARYHINSDWWTIYNIPQLNALENQALANNINLKQAAISVNKALYQANILGANLVPSYSGSFGTSASKNLKSGDFSKSFSSQLGLSYELDLWHKLSATSDAQAWEYEASRQDLANTRLTIINNVADAYFNIAYLNEAIALTQKTINQYQEINRIVRSKYQYGKVDSSQPNSAAQTLLSAENSLLSLQNSRNNMVQTLRNLLNLKPNETLAADPHTFHLPVPQGVDLNVPISTLANRPDLRAAEYRLQSALQSQVAQQRSWYPSITLGATLSSATNNTKNIFKIPLLGSSASINLPFLNWQTLKWQNKAAQANFDSAKLNFEQALTTALNEVNTNYQLYRNANTTLQNIQQRHILDQKNSHYYKVRYEYGKNELKDWLDALNIQYSSAQSMLNQRYEVLKYESMIYKAMAGRYTAK